MPCGCRPGVTAKAPGVRGALDGSREATCANCHVRREESWSFAEDDIVWASDAARPRNRVCVIRGLVQATLSSGNRGGEQRATSVFDRPARVRRLDAYPSLLLKSNTLFHSARQRDSMAALIAKFKRSVAGPCSPQSRVFPIALHASALCAHHTHKSGHYAV